MLEDDYQQTLRQLLARIPCNVELPPDWNEVRESQLRAADRHHDERRFMRRSFSMHAVLEIQQTLPAVPREHQFGCVLAIDLSRNGIAFLHTQQLYPEEHVLLWLPIGKTQARVARCTRHGARCFEMGCRIQTA